MNVLKRALIGLSIAITVAGCAGNPLAAAGMGTVSGHVSTRACGGVIRENVAGCQFRPAAGVTLSFRELTAGTVRMASTNAAGFYSISLPAGKYQVDPEASISVPGREAPRLLTIAPGQSVRADFSYTFQLL